MCLLFETINIQNGCLQNRILHEKRMNLSRKALFNSKDVLDLKCIAVPAHFTGKCRITYQQIIEKTEFETYTPRKIDHLVLVTDNEIEYTYKFTNRKLFELLKSGISANDEILIVKNGRITDTSYSNVAFFDGVQWFTPSSFLLNGTMRQYLLQTKKISEKPISVNDISNFTHICLINAMLSIGDVTIATDQIISSVIW